MPRVPAKTNVYVDGFNLYYGLVARGKNKSLPSTPYRWLNLGKLAQFLLPESDIRAIHYFTAMIKARPDDPQRVSRQEIYVRALRTVRGLNVYLGNYQEHPVWRPLANPGKGKKRFVEVLWSEEKGSDVNLATQLLVDAYEGSCEMAAVISNDSDLASPIRIASAKMKRGVVVFNPHPGATARRLKKVATEYRPIRDKALAATVFPDTLKDRKGIITKPDKW